jgi:hypothetical protein
MRRRWGVLVLLLLVVLATALGGCGSGSSTDLSSGDDGAGDVGVEDLRPKASEMTDQMIANDWPAVRAQFDDNMKNKLAEDGLANAWKSVVAQKGAFQSRGKSAQQGSPAGQELFVFDTPLEFERGAMKARLALHPDGTIAGLFLLVPEA